MAAGVPRLLALLHISQHVKLVPETRVDDGRAVTASFLKSTKAAVSVFNGNGFHRETDYLSVVELEGGFKSNSLHFIGPLKRGKPWSSLRCVRYISVHLFLLLC